MDEALSRDVRKGQANTRLEARSVHPMLPEWSLSGLFLLLLCRCCFVSILVLGGHRSNPLTIG